MALTTDQALVRDQMIRDLDTRCAAIYARRLRFAREADIEEAQAQAYKDAGYTGNVPRLVAAHASAASITATEAADAILADAQTYRAALLALAEARARRRQLARLDTMAAVRTAYLAADGEVTVAEAALP